MSTAGKRLLVLQLLIVLIVGELSVRTVVMMQFTVLIAVESSAVIEMQSGFVKTVKL